MPIDDSIKKLTDEELDAKVLALQKIVFSNNQNLAMQAYNIIGLYQDEQLARGDKKFAAYMKKHKGSSEPPPESDDAPINIG